MHQVIRKCRNASLSTQIQTYFPNSSSTWRWLQAGFPWKAGRLSIPFQWIFQSVWNTYIFLPLSFLPRAPVSKQWQEETQSPWKEVLPLLPTTATAFCKRPRHFHQEGNRLTCHTPQSPRPKCSSQQALCSQKSDAHPPPE